MLIDGKAISQQIKDELKEKTAALKEKGIEVTLAVILVGEDPASQVYVRNKKKACEYIGYNSLSYELSGDTSQDELLKLINELNDRKDVDGILVQMPLPEHIDEKAVIDAIRYYISISFSFSISSEAASCDVLTTLKFIGLFVSSPIRRSTLGRIILKSCGVAGKPSSTLNGFVIRLKSFSSNIEL